MLNLEMEFFLNVILKLSIKKSIISLYTFFILIIYMINKWVSGFSTTLYRENTH